ncbi:hypothetical protein AVEN_214098-1 [Araneus ventricosus]|uniref:Uncharacterized protein n=1 Tax=Araneus ventricosus TaxID=182803 RepID=A0A4Y2C6E7_ARAVE|nr:hypothetical protein AVEN_214098-1 [Araneus ventricosus]
MGAAIFSVPPPFPSVQGREAETNKNTSVSSLLFRSIISTWKIRVLDKKEQHSGILPINSQMNRTNVPLHSALESEAKRINGEGKGSKYEKEWGVKKRLLKTTTRKWTAQ